MVTVCDVKADGSCFIRSVYNSSKSIGALKHVLRRMTGSSKDDGEESFVRATRALLSDVISTGKDGRIIKNVYNHLKTLDHVTYKEIITSSFPSWFVKSFKKLPETEQEFRATIAKKVLHNSNWVNEIEVRIAQYLIKKQSKWRLEVIHNKPDKKTWNPSANTIYVLNLREAHYNAIILTKNIKTCASGKVLNQDTNRCISNASCKGYEIMYKQLLVKHTSSLH